jgi:hypothetical protein
MTTPRELAHATELLRLALVEYTTEVAAGYIATAIQAGVDAGEWETARILEEIALGLHRETLRRRARA